MIVFQIRTSGELSTTEVWGIATQKLPAGGLKKDTEPLQSASQSLSDNMKKQGLSFADHLRLALRQECMNS